MKLLQHDARLTSLDQLWQPPQRHLNDWCAQRKLCSSSVNPLIVSSKDFFYSFFLVMVCFIVSSYWTVLPGRETISQRQTVASMGDALCYLKGTPVTVLTARTRLNLAFCLPYKAEDNQSSMELDCSAPWVRYPMRERRATESAQQTDMRQGAVMYRAG